MANYYWLGVTGACGNVNNPANWTLWSPQGACGFLPLAAATGPAYNDTVYFTRFSVSGACYGVDYYPQVSPQGQMYGRTGAAAPQNFLSVKVADDCPVPIGTSNHYFKFNADAVELRISADNPQATTATSYLDIGKHANRTSYCQVDVNAGKLHTYWIKGQVRSVASVSISRASNSIMHFKDLEFADPTGQILIWQVSPSIFSADKFYLYDTTTGYNKFYVSGNGQINIYNGYSQSLDTTNTGTIDTNSNHNAVVNFLPAEYSGACGPNQLTRTYINELIMKGNKTTSTANVNHGVDFVNVKLQGGTINFSQSADTDASVVQKGYMYSATSKIVAANPTVSIGSNGDFTIMDNSNSTFAPDITLKGNWNIDLNPGVIGVCGPN